MAAEPLSPDEIERALMRQFPDISRERARELARASVERREKRQAESAAEAPQAPKTPIALPLLLTLPWSALCSDNRKYGAAVMRNGETVYGKLVMQTEYRTAKAKTREIARAAVDGAAPLAQPLALHARVWVPDNRPGHDVANFAKCAHDALEEVVYVKDEWLHDVRWRRAGVDVDRPRAELTITLDVASALEGCQ